MTQILILGCGRLGTHVAHRLITLGHQVHGVRRSSSTDASIPMTVGNAAETTTWAMLGSDWQAVLLCATPGLRRGRDNNLDRIAALVHERLPAARFVYSGSTAVYGDAGGAAVAEDGPLAADAGPLLAIERAVLEQVDSLVLRMPALVGAARDRAIIRAREAATAGKPLLIPGDPDRPFPFIHEQDAADVATAALIGVLHQECGVMNAAAPIQLTARDYYREASHRAKITTSIVSDGTTKPARSIDSSRLWQFMSQYAWKSAWVD
ncbi:MAG: NAD-dependent epimerase/dehydratase family protein [Planctomycetota bacterium]